MTMNFKYLPIPATWADTRTDTETRIQGTQLRRLPCIQTRRQTAMHIGWDAHKYLYRQTDTQVDIHTDTYTGAQIYTHILTQAHRYTHRYLHRRTYIHTDTYTEAHKYRHSNSHSDTWTNKQTRTTVLFGSPSFQKGLGSCNIPIKLFCHATISHQDMCTLPPTETSRWACGVYINIGKYAHTRGTRGDCAGVEAGRPKYKVISCKIVSGSCVSVMNEKWIWISVKIK